MFRRLELFVRRLITAWFGPPRDPFAAVREPRRRGPSGRLSAVAVAEPRD